MGNRKRRTNLLVAADDLSIRVFDRRYVGVSERPANEAQHQRTFTDTARSEHDHPVVVALFRHRVLSASSTPTHTCLFLPVTASATVINAVPRHVHVLSAVLAML